MRNIAKHCESSPSEPDCRVFRGFNLAHTSVFSLSAAGGERRGEVAVHSHSPIGCLLAIYRSLRGTLNFQLSTNQLHSAFSLQNSAFLPAAQVRRIIAALDEKCRDVEF
jgi:hypothetical protein